MSRKMKWEKDLTKLSRERKIDALKYFNENNKDMEDFINNFSTGFGKPVWLIVGEYDD